MKKTIVLPDGSKCYSAPNCRKHFPAPASNTSNKNTPEKNYLKISKTMSYLLRHHPEAAGITLTSDGWVNITTFIENINKSGILPQHITVGDVAYVVANDSKQRYSMTDGRIRAAQGHSTDVDLGMIPQKPPVFLYHGTTAEAAKNIFKEGLKAMSRQHVHLSQNKETALSVGSRHGKPIILVINAVEAYKNGIKFYQSANGVWLTEALPAEFLQSKI